MSGTWYLKIQVSTVFDILSLFFLVVSGEHFQYHDNQFSQSRRSECHAIMGDLLHILCLWRSLRIRNHFTSNENQNVSQIGSLYAEGRDLCHGCCGLDCLPYRLPYIQYRLLGRLSPVNNTQKSKTNGLYFSRRRRSSSHRITTV